MIRTFPKQAVIINDVGEKYTRFKEEHLDILQGVDLHTIMPETIKFCEMWNVPFSFVIDTMTSKGLLHTLFEFGYPLHGTLVENGIFVIEKYFYTNYWHTHATPVYDVYVVEHKNVKRYLREVVPEIIKTHYSWLYVEKKEKRFNENLPDLSPKAFVDFYNNNEHFKALTLEDIAHIISNPDWRDEEVTTYGFEYDVDTLYFECGGEYITCFGRFSKHKLRIPVEAIVKRDISIVGQYRTMLYDNYGNMEFNKQNKACFWRTKDCKKIKDMFKEKVANVENVL